MLFYYPANPLIFFILILTMLNNDTAAQVSDTTGDALCTKAGTKKN